MKREVSQYQALKWFSRLIYSDCPTEVLYKTKHFYLSFSP